MTDKKFNRKLEKIRKQCERHKKMKELLDSYDGYLPAKRLRKKRKVSNIVITIIIIAVVGYTVANFWLAKTTGIYMDSTFTTCFYAFWGTEVAVLAGIKITDTIKIKNNNDDNQEENKNDQC